MGLKGKADVVLAYNGVDGFCAAAAVLIDRPGAELVLTSASRLAGSLRRLAEKCRDGARVHICGVGFSCDWREIESSARELKERGVGIIWYCGRGYLDQQRANIARIGEAAFLDSASNTAAVIARLGLARDRRTQHLERIASSDPALDPADVSAETADWRDQIQAAVSSYLKYQDEEAGPATIRSLTETGAAPRDYESIYRYRRFSDHHIIRGGSPMMKDLRRLIARCAVVDEPVILTGESGTGKEYAAQLLHERSPRSGEPFHAVNCAVFAGNPGLANSTLFGHVKGAFTGASAHRNGAFLSAARGTLFLDELGLLPLEVQGKLLRVLEEGMVVREGSDLPVAVDVRIVAATSRDLPGMIRDGRFLPDLYHRINTLRIGMPALRDHPEDIPQIARERLAELKREGYGLSLEQKDYDLLAGYDWPGNVRQLFKLLKRMAYLGLTASQALQEERRLGSLRTVEEPKSETDRALFPETADDLGDFEQVKKAYFTRAWELCGRNYAAAAGRLRVAENTLRKYVGV